MKNIFKLTILSAICLLSHATQCTAQNTEHDLGKLLETLVAEKWGTENTLLPSSKVLVQYEEDLGERWVINFETGDVKLECLWKPEVSLNNPSVTENMISAVSNLYVRMPVLPERMIKEQQRNGYIPALNAKPVETEYVIKKGDTLSEISEHLRVALKEIMLINGITNPHRIQIGQTLIIPAAPAHIHTHNETYPIAKESLLLGQLRNPENGEIITSATIGTFGRQIVQKNGIEEEIIYGDDGHSRKLTRVNLSLAENHLQTRARHYYPLVREQSERFGHDPALIMAVIHTESAFNPQAASSANAYGLMQLVPSSGGREAYKWLHRKDVKPSPSYLLKPRQNLELGTIYFKLLKERTFAGVKNPKSRLYCAIAAYNGGGVNVGHAFTGRKSVQASVKAINARSPAEVRSLLENNSPHKETRRYLKQVLDRIAIYSTPQWQR